VSDREPVIVAARRSPIATRGRGLAGLTVEQLAAPVLRATLQDARRTMGGSHAVADVILGNCMGPGGNPARVTALAAGLDASVPGMTLDRQCGSGLAAILNAVTAIRAGDARLRLAGGVESASTAPVRSIDGRPYDRAPFAPAGFADPDMTRAAEDLASAMGISRIRQDAAALRSRDRAFAAGNRGVFEAELVPLGGLSRDEAASAVSPATIARFAPLFPSGTLTAGNSCRVSDGAALVAVAPSSLDRGGAAGLAVISHATVGCDPSLPGLGAALAIRTALEHADLTVASISAFEIVEAFAAQLLAVLDVLGIDDDDLRVSSDGGALAFGHPWGASGAISIVRLFSRLVRGGAPPGSLGVAAASVGGGMGVAAVFEVVR
jgi:acetyl-CoA C-acetyltransferase